MNPHYDYEKLDWKQIEFSQPDLSYEFNSLCFWITPDKRVFSASDSGCSCPIPFEAYEGKDVKEIEQKLERVGSYEQALSIFIAWNEEYKGKPHLLKQEFYNDGAILKEILP